MESAKHKCDRTELASPRSPVHIACCFTVFWEVQKRRVKLNREWKGER